LAANPVRLLTIGALPICMDLDSMEFES